VGRGVWGVGREDSGQSSVKPKEGLAGIEKRQNEANLLGC
jgi:hypothetical protein